MKKKKVLFIPLLLMGLILVIASSCEKNDGVEALIPELSTTEVANILHTSATSGGNITSDSLVMVTSCGVCWSKEENPTVADNKVTSKAIAGEFSSKLSDLSPGTTYYVRAFATNVNGTGYGNTVSFETPGIEFTDARDGNVYKTVTIGNQVWMAENLRYLPSVTVQGANNVSESIPYYYVYGNESADLEEVMMSETYNVYGVLYNWTAVTTGDICPEGWHVSTDAEWIELIEYVGGEENAGNVLKELGTTHWSDDTGATDEVGFRALPGGGIDSSGNYFYMSWYGAYWCPLEGDADSPWLREFRNTTTSASLYKEKRMIGYSVRCVLD